MSTTPLDRLANKHARLNRQAQLRSFGTDPVAYYVAADHFVFRGKTYRQAACPELAPRDMAELYKLKLHLGKGWIRKATDDERKKAAEAPTAPNKSHPAASSPAPTVVAALSPVQVQMVPLANIRPDPTQPRKDFSEGSMKELVDSIKQVGVQQDILVRPMSRWRQIVGFVSQQRQKRDAKGQGWGLSFDLFWAAKIEISSGELLEGPIVNRLLAEGRIERSAVDEKLCEPAAGAIAPLSGPATLPGEPEWLEIVFGERRWRGAQLAGLTEIPAKVRELSDVEAALLQAVENLDRDDLKPLEEAAQYDKLLHQLNLPMARVMEVTGRAKNTIWGKLKLLQLPDAAREAVNAGTLPAVTAERIARLDPELQTVATAEILHPKDTWSHSGKGVLSDRAAQEKIKELEKQAAEEVKRREIEAELKKAGYRLLNDLERRDASKYGGEINGAGWLDGSQKCERDPKGRTWAKVLKGVEGVTPYATTMREWSAGEYKVRGVPVFKREEANAALKKLGLWEAEGSAKEKEKLAQRKEREKKKREEAEMLADIAGIVESASSQDPRKIRAVARGVVHAFTASGYADANVRFVAERRDIVASPQGIIVELRKLGDTLPLPGLLGLVAEIALVQIGRSWENMKQGREAMESFLNGKDRGSAGARTVARAAEEARI